jgi:TetR/AcrR family transcriptional regulator, regulator of mycofactocin system
MGRPPVTSRAELEHIALALFLESGFESTTVKDIARGAGISRRTFFRYYASKNDVAWGDFDEHLARFQAHFDAVPSTVPMTTALRECILAFNDFSDDELPWLRQRMTLLLRVSALQAHSVLRYAAWCDIVANFVARRTGRSAGTLVPQVVARCALGTAIAAYERWLEDDGAHLRGVLDAALSIWLQAGTGSAADVAGVAAAGEDGG